MPRHDQARRLRLPNSVMHRAWRLAAVLLTFALLAACSLPGGAFSPPFSAVRVSNAHEHYPSLGGTAETGFEEMD